MESWLREHSSFSHDHPAEYDQRVTEFAEKLQKADGFIIYLYSREDEDEEGNVIGEGHASIGCTPGLPVGQFLKEGVDSINEVIVSMVERYKEEARKSDGETKE